MDHRGNSLKRLVALGLLCLACGTHASAGPMLNLGSQFNGTTVDFAVQFGKDPSQQFNIGGNSGGGNIVGATLSGYAPKTIGLPYVYCLQYAVDIGVPGHYDAHVTTNGEIDESNTPMAGAGQVAWLMDKYAVAAGKSLTLQAGLQAAIWSTVTTDAGGTFALNGGTTQDVIDAYNADIKALGKQTASTSGLLWLTPFSGDKNYQALVSVPEPSTTVMAATATLVVGGFLRRQRRKSKIA